MKDVLAPTPASTIYDQQRRRQDRTIECIRHGRQDANGYWIPGPLWWLQNCTETFDPHYLEKKLDSPHRAFPDLPYFPWFFSRLLTKPIVFVPKSREMMVSWAVIAYAVWLCQLFAGVRVLVQAQKQDKASELVRGTEPPGYARTLYERQDDWLRNRFPLAMRIEDLPADKMVWKNESAIQAVAAGPDQVRMYHPTVMIFDEMAFLDGAEASFGAAVPVAKQIVAVSTAGPSFFGEVCSND
jgi:hypothetical protein